MLRRPEEALAKNALSQPDGDCCDQRQNVGSGQDEGSVTCDILSGHKSTVLHTQRVACYLSIWTLMHATLV